MLWQHHLVEMTWIQCCHNIGCLLGRVGPGQGPVFPKYVPKKVLLISHINLFNYMLKLYSGFILNKMCQPLKMTVSCTLNACTRGGRMIPNILDSSPHFKYMISHNGSRSFNEQLSTRSHRQHVQAAMLSHVIR